MTRHRPGPVLRRVLRLPAYLYDIHAGWLLDHRFLRLTHVGRRSGRRYRTMLEVIGAGADGEVVVMAGLGRTADWFRNIQAHPAVEVAVGRDRFRPVHRVLGEDEAVAVLAGYERRERRFGWLERPVISWLVGWSYDGTEADERRLVRERPLVGFRAAPGS
jgi:deazaflavin-dependent oxidoreductase (nitroreductase family)